MNRSMLTEGQGGESYVVSQIIQKDESIELVVSMQKNVSIHMKTHTSTT